MSAGVLFQGSSEHNRGVVTIFLVIIFTALLLLAGLIVDAVRLLAAEKKVQSSLETSARSVLAGYNKDLVGEFGLYGFSVQGAQGDLEHYLRINLEHRDQGLKLVSCQLQRADAHAVESSSLLNKEVLEQQILEYIKYKGPVVMTKNLVEMFSQGLIKRTDYTYKGRELSNKQKELNHKLEQLNDKIVLATKSFSRQWGAASPTAIQGSAGFVIDSLEALQQDLAQTLDGNNPLSCIAQYSKALDDINTSAEEFNDSLADYDDSFGQLEGQKLSGFSDGGLIDALKQKETQLKTVIAKNIEILRDIERLQKKLLEGAGDQSQAGNESRLALEGEVERLYQQLQVIEPFEPTKAQMKNELKQKIQKEWAKLFKKLETWWKTFNVHIDPADKISKSDRQEINQITGPYGFSGIKKIFKNLLGRETHELEEEEENVFFMIKGLVDSIVKVAQDDLLLVEYIMDKYTYVTSSTQRERVLKQGEVEYILCGQNSQMVNNLRVCEEIFMLRFAIDSVCEFIKSKIPEFDARLICALGMGFLDASVEMIELYQGKDIAAFPSIIPLSIGPSEYGIEPKISYSDHLRLLLLMKHPAVLLERMQDLMQVDIRALNRKDQSLGTPKTMEDFSLATTYTVIKAEADVVVDLWFLPQIMRFLGRSTSGVEQGWVIHKEVVQGYEGGE